MEKMLNNSVNVYWACVESEWMFAGEPGRVGKDFYNRFTLEESNSLANLHYCPSFNSNLKNLFTLKSIYDFNFRIEDNRIITDKHNQAFFNKHVVVRSFPKKFFSFSTDYIFFTDEPSLETTVYEYPFLEDNNITERCIIPSGRLDIGRWFRHTEFAFLLKKNYNEFKIEKDEVFSYIRFHTSKQINFKQFRYNDTFKNFNNDGFSLTTLGPLHTLENYYKNFKNKKLILQEIKNNLIV